MHIDPADMSPRDRYFWMIGSILPRPIALISTISTGGILNLAPFSFFSGVSGSPAVVSVSIGAKKGGDKDTLANIKETGELVVNMVSEEIAKPMVQAAADFPPEISEFEQVGLMPVESDLVKPPRVGEAPVSMECQLHRLVEVGDNPTTLVLAEVLRFHANDEVLTNGLPDPMKCRPFARLGGQSYAFLGKMVEIPRPKP